MDEICGCIGKVDSGSMRLHACLFFLFRKPSIDAGLRERSGAALFPEYP
ncbi:MAG: hypothetical protein LUQ33_05090 [Methanoregulaceae archaeon]|nr:hypothetical protein [Methanoregulaceae archaeon]